MQWPLLAIPLFIVVLCCAGTMAGRLKVPAAVLFLIAGVGWGVVAQDVDWLPIFDLKPEYILCVFLPPLLMEAAFFTSWRDMRRETHPILQLSIVLVVITSILVAWVFHTIVPNFGWALGLVLGAMVAPPDAVAATSIMAGQRVPRRIATILEGESLINDASSLLIFKIALIALVAGTFSWGAVGFQLIWVIVCGVAIGIGVGWIFFRVYRWIGNDQVNLLWTFAPPYIAFMLGEWVNTSSVVAVVVCGLYVGWRAPKEFSSSFRIPAESTWRMVVFTLNGAVFLLIGQHIPELSTTLSAYAWQDLLRYAAVVCLLVLVTRFAWVFAVAWGRWRYAVWRGHGTPPPPWWNVSLIGWCGMRGVVTLAMALALPHTLDNGLPFPHRDLLVFLAVTVIVFTLVVQGISVPWLTARLPLSYNQRLSHERWHARRVAAQKALTVLNAIACDDMPETQAKHRLRTHYEERLLALGDAPPTHAAEHLSIHLHPLLRAEGCLWFETLAAEREAVVHLRDTMVINDDVMHELLREIDLLAQRFTPQSAQNH